MPYGATQTIWQLEWVQPLSYLGSTQNLPTEATVIGKGSCRSQLKVLIRMKGGKGHPNKNYVEEMK